MTNSHDGELLEALTRLNTAISTFSLDLFGKPDQEKHIGLALLLLDGADRVLGRLAKAQQNEHGTGGS